MPLNVTAFEIRDDQMIAVFASDEHGGWWGAEYDEPAWAAAEYDMLEKMSSDRDEVPLDDLPTDGFLDPEKEMYGLFESGRGLVSQIADTNWTDCDYGVDEGQVVGDAGDEFVRQVMYFKG